MEHPERWAELLSRASPDFIELKGATLAPIFSKVGLTMMNMPTHAEVKEFGLHLTSHLSGYSAVCEHEHSNAVLLASDRLVSPSGGWRTWIDFDRFADLCASNAEL